jgi:NADPH-dependent curcumin reductase CurA
MEAKLGDNPQWCLRTRPVGEVHDEDFEIRNGVKPVPGANEVLVRNIYLLVPPSMRLWMNEKESYFPPQALGQVMMGITLGVVEVSNHPAFKPGMYVNGMGGWQHWYVAPFDQLMPLVPHPEIPLGAYRTILDVQGITAYGGLTDICKPKAGETLVVTAAAGSVGSLVCQIGKQLGLRVIGIAGGIDKCNWLLNECDVDGAINYKSEDVGTRLDELCPQGIDMLFESVGGPVMDLVLDRINTRARIALCGMISAYNGDGTQSTQALMQLVNKSARMEGFLVLNYMDRYAEIVSRLQDWVLDGKLKYQLDILDGLDQVTEAMSRVFQGRNLGVQLVRISPEQI